MEIEIGTSSENQGCSTGTRIFLTVFFSIFLLVGLGIIVAMGKDVLQTIDTYAWEQRSAEIESSEVAENPEADQPFTLRAQYRYEYQGRTFTSSQVSLSGESSSDYGEIQALQLKYQPGTQADCFVDPQSPSQAVLVRDSLWSVLLLLFPLPFIAVGAGGLWAAWFWKESGKNQEVESISNKAKTGSGARLFGILFFAVFFAVGAAISYFIFIKPITQVFAAKSWQQVPAVVQYSKVRTHESDDGNTYSVDILYQYQFEGRPYKSNRYVFFTGSSSGRRSKAKIVERYPSGKQIYCFVDPDNPHQAVINRDISSDLWFGLIPLVFVLVGAAGMYFVWQSGRKDKQSASTSFVQPEQRYTVAGDKSGVQFSTQFAEETWLPKPSNAFESLPSGEILMEPIVSPWSKVFALLLFGAFWNGIVSIFLFEVVEGWQRGSPDWIGTIFLTPFLLIGIGLIVGVLYCLLAVFNPRPSLLLTSPAVSLGETLHFRWKLSGRTHVLSDLRITLKGVEEATYQRGTSTYTDRETFCTIGIERIGPHGQFQGGQASVLIPADSMHSFCTEHNKITWHIELQGDIPRWPDLKEDFPLVVLPGKA